MCNEKVRGREKKKKREEKEEGKFSDKIKNGGKDEEEVFLFQNLPKPVH